MKIPFTLFLTSLAFLAVTLSVPDYGDAVVIAFAVTIASALALLQSQGKGKRPPKGEAKRPPEADVERPAERTVQRQPEEKLDRPPEWRVEKPPSWEIERQPKGKPDWQVVIDGSNVIHWQDNTPNIAPLQAVLKELHRRGYSYGVIFDANIGYKLRGKHMSEAELAKDLRLPRENIKIAPSGKPADPTILTIARDLNGLVLSDDRFRDWAEDFPEVTDPSRFLRGGYEDGKLWLE